MYLVCACMGPAGGRHGRLHRGAWGGIGVLKILVGRVGNPKKKAPYKDKNGLPNRYKKVT